MNQRTLDYQQAQSKHWHFHKTPELRAFYPQGTFGKDLTNFSIPLDPTWDTPGHYDSSDDYVPEGERLVDPLFGKPMSPLLETDAWKNRLKQIRSYTAKVKKAHLKVNSLIREWERDLGYRGTNWSKEDQEGLDSYYKGRIKRAKDSLKRATDRLEILTNEVKYYEY